MDVFAGFLSTWYKKPFDQDGDALQWVLFLGFIIAVSYAWTRVLNQLKE